MTLRIPLSGWPPYTAEFTVDLDGQPHHMQLRLELSHLQIRRMISKALANSGHRTVEAGGALVVREMRP